MPSSPHFRNKEQAVLDKKHFQLSQQGTNLPFNRIFFFVKNGHEGLEKRTKTYFKQMRLKDPDKHSYQGNCYNGRMDKTLPANLIVC